MKNSTNLIKAIVCFTILFASVTRSYGQASVVLEEWPFTTNASDSTAVRATGVVGTIPTLNHLYLSNDLNNGSGSQLLPYSPTNGQATSASNVTPGDGKWATAAGGPGGNGNRNIYEQFQVIPTTGNSLRVDSFIAFSAFASSSSGTSFMVVYSLSNFVSDSTPIPGYTFGGSATQVPLTQTNAAPFPPINLPLASSGGVLVPAGDTLTIRVYPTCSSSSAGRYFELLDVIAKGAVISSGGCLTQPGAIVASLPSICAGQNGAIYSVPAVSGATSYTWTYSGTGTTFSSTTDSVTINFNNTATSGNLSVVANGACGSSIARTSAIIVNALPVNVITTNTGGSVICNGTNLILNASTSAGSTYQWKYNGNLIPGAFSAGYTVTSATLGTYKAVVSSSAGCTDTSVGITVTTGTYPPLAVINPSTAQNFCPGGHTVLSITKVAGNTYLWLKNGASASDTLATDTISAAGTYSVKATSASGCFDTSASVVVTLGTLPGNSVTASGALSFCTGSSVTLTVGATTGATYQWLNAGAAITGAITAAYVASASGTYSVKVTGSNTCTDTSTISTVTVGAVPTVAVITPAGAQTFCPGGHVILSITKVPGFSYVWQKNGVATSDTTATDTVSASGSFAVRASSVPGCADTSAITVVTAGTFPGDTVTASGALFFCTGGSVVLTSTVVSGATYQWLNNGAAINGATTNTYTASAAGSYSIRVTGSNTCTDTSTAKVVTVNAYPADTVTASGALTFCAGGSVTLTVNSTTGATYQWLDLGNVITAATANTYSATATGVYNVLVTSNGCTDTSNIKAVTVHPLPVPVVTETNRVLSTGAFVTYQWNLNGTPVPSGTTSTLAAAVNGIYTVTVTDANGCSNTSAPDTVVDVAVPTIQSLGAQIKLYPNPATDVVYINAPVKVNVAIAGMDGRLLLRKEEATEISVANLANGIYMIMVYDQHNMLMRTDKLVKN